jgi:hypothetical protein
MRKLVFYGDLDSFNLKEAFKELKSDKFHKLVGMFKYVDPNNRTVFF